MICPNCQSPQPDGESFCDQCGTPLSAPVPAAPQQYSPPPQYPPQQQYVPPPQPQQYAPPPQQYVPPPPQYVPPPPQYVPPAPPQQYVPPPQYVPQPQPAYASPGGQGNCPACGHPNPPGSGFCELCGSPLIGGQGPTPPIALPRFTLLSGQTIDLKPGVSQWMIGRADPMQNHQPDVDLTPYDPEQVTGRKHAILSMNGGQAMLTSITTTNWTKVNGVRLTPNQPTPLKGGDRVEFSKIVLTFNMP